ncbi:Ferredoxin-NADP reductase [Massilia sp. PDC64]|nr:hybrid-cluster NAD(P)-dependent oxidoreductase [Massilia sp. PDC64]SDC63814.1 Ferredoxin-NADP reductase [Massilia sp. PDC64]
MHNPTLAQLAVPWDGDRDDTLVCRAVRQETHDVKTFVFSAPEPRLFRYAPGQFITLELEIAGQAIQRCYTLSSTPSRPDTVSITVKRVPGGTVSNWLHDHMQAGATIRVRGPAGSFSCFLHPMPPKQKYLFLSAGSGITPLMSMARAMHDLVLDADIAFLHSARTPDDIIFARELELMAHNRDGLFRLGTVCERRGAQAAWAGFNGFLSLAVLQNVAPDFRERKVFTCGPAPYMAAVRAMLAEGGFDMAHYHEESFSFETLAPAGGDEAALDGAGFKVTFSRSGDELACAPGQTILAAAKAAGVRFPVSCTQGLCGTCKTKMVSGQVDMRHAGGIRQREIDQGWILPCCSKPLADVVLER